MDKFIARYEENGIKKSVLFSKTSFDQTKAEAWLEKKGIQNFFFFFEPIPPKEMGENGIMLSGEVGFDIELDIILPYITSGKDIILDTFGGDSWEALKIYDAIRGLNLDPSIGILGTCASAGMQILLAAKPAKRWMTANSRGLIHNPWAYEVGDDGVFRKAAAELEREKLKIANIYVQESGKTLDEILALMKEEKLLDAGEMLALNFVNSTKWNNLESEILINNEEMNQEEKKKLNSIESMINKLSKFFTPKNLVLQDVNGAELDFGAEVETREQIQVGNTATVEGSPAAGDYTLADGTVFVFEGGTLTEIKEPEAEEDTAEVEELQEEVANLQTENADLQNKLTASDALVLNLQNEQTEVKSKLTEVKTAFDEFKNKFSDEKPKPNTPGADDQGDTKKKFAFKSKNK